MTDTRGGTQPAPYALGHSDHELRRLEIQARYLAPLTRRFFEGAGLAPGMHVLDVGSGMGDVAFLAAEMVGPSGSVVGTDAASAAVAGATERAKRHSVRNVTFREGDPAKLEFDRPFDAVVGRYVLMFQPDATPMLRGLVERLKPGGIVVFHELDWGGVRSHPPAPLFEQCCQWLVQALQHTS
ncbi:MAG: class I SAM-dependent methyltransferase, partial [Candidatus Eiseniibacteriota bacterium]